MCVQDPEGLYRTWGGGARKDPGCACRTLGGEAGPGSAMQDLGGPRRARGGHACPTCGYEPLSSWCVGSQKKREPLLAVRAVKGTLFSAMGSGLWGAQRGRQPPGYGVGGSGGGLWGGPYR